MSDETKHMSKYARKVAARLKAQQAVSETFEDVNAADIEARAIIARDAEAGNADD